MVEEVKVVMVELVVKGSLEVKEKVVEALEKEGQVEEDYTMYLVYSIDMSSSINYML
jgi:hypothetical protein